MLVNFLMLLRVFYHILTDIQDRKDLHLYISLFSMFAVLVF